MEKQTVFIKRYPSKGELPIENVWLDTNIGYVKFDTSDSRWLVIGGIVEWWLEEIELPSEEEIQAESTAPFKDWGELQEEYDDFIKEDSKIFLKGANFILNKLKGDTNESK